MLSFLGRLHPDKGVHLAIDAARAAGLPIVVAASATGPWSWRYVRRYVEPRLGPDVTMLGPVDAQEKRSLLAPSRRPGLPHRLGTSAFGMVMIEAMACGTPVVALRREIGARGRRRRRHRDPLRRRRHQLADATHAARRLDQSACREHVRDVFDVATMARRYQQIFRASIAARSPTRRRTAAPARAPADGTRPRPLAARTVAAAGNRRHPARDVSQAGTAQGRRDALFVAGLLLLFGGPAPGCGLVSSSTPGRGTGAGGQHRPAFSAATTPGSHWVSRPAASKRTGSGRGQSSDERGTANVMDVELEAE